jgi:hypothetical protein
MAQTRQEFKLMFQMHARVEEFYMQSQRVLRELSDTYSELARSKNLSLKQHGIFVIKEEASALRSFATSIETQLKDCYTELQRRLQFLLDSPRVCTDLVESYQHITAEYESLKRNFDLHQVSIPNTASVASEARPATPRKTAKPPQFLTPRETRTRVAHRRTGSLRF